MMEFTIKRDYFITQLNDTLKAISPRTTLPILTGIKIDAKEHEVILTGSDSEISIEITITKTVVGRFCQYFRNRLSSTSWTILC